jgi:hypothetical protein
MKPGNFNWFLHTMLFYHTQHVLEKAEKRRNRLQSNDGNEEDNSD